MPIRGASRVAPTSSLKTALVGGLLLLALIPKGASSAGPEGSPSRFFPAQGLTAYLEFDGLAAHESAWKATAARAILVEARAGATLLDVERRMMDRIFEVGSFEKMTGADFVAAQDHLVRRGFAVATFEEDGETSTVVVLNGFGDQAVRDRFGRLLRSMLRVEDGKPPASASARVRGRELHDLGGRDKPETPPPGIPSLEQYMKASKAPPTDLTWWLEGDAVIFVKGPTPGLFDALMKPDRAKKDLRALHKARVAAVLDAIEAKRANVSTHPAHVAATAEGRDLDGFEATGLFFAEAGEGQGMLDGLSGLGGADSVEAFILKVTGLERAGRVVGRWGFRGKSLLTDVRFESKLPWPGFLGQLDRRGFSRDRLPPIPRGSGAFVVGAIDRAGTFDEFETVRDALKPEAAAVVDAAGRTIDEATTRPLRDALMRHLGPTWTVYAAPGRGGEAVPAFLIGIDDPEAVNKALGELASALNDHFRKQKGEALAVERLPAPERGYRLVSPAGVVLWLTDALRPTILVGKSSLVVAANPALARAAIAAESRPEARWEPTGELARSLGGLPANVSFLCVGNPRDSAWPEAVARLPGTAGPFLGKFFHVDLGEQAPADRPPGLLDVLGVPKAGVGKGPAPPRADELRRLIDPGVLAATVEERSFRVIGLESLPLSCVGLGVHFEPSGAGKVDIKFAPAR